MTVLATLARLSPLSPDPSDDLRRALAFLGWDVPAERVVRAGYGAGTLGLVITGGWMFLAPSALLVPVAAGLLATSVLAIHAIHSTPTLLATARRTSALGDAPDLVARAVLRMRISPAPERAAAFAADAGGRPLARSLHRHVRQSANRPRSGLGSFGAEWEAWFPSLRRATELVTAAGAAPEADRDRTLDRALDVVLVGTTEQMRSFARAIRGPAAGLYAFGVLLPLALIALLPAAHAAGVAVTPLTVGLIYGVGLPGLLVVGSGWLLANRPVAFRPPAVTTAHPDVPDRGRLAPALGVVAGGAGWLIASRLLPGWAQGVAAAGFGVGTALYVRYRPVTDVYERIEAAEAGLSEALRLIGRRVSNGQAVEEAIAEAGQELDGELGGLLEAAAARQRQLKTDVASAFLGPAAPLAAFPSPRLRSSAELLSTAAREGAPAGEAISALADHVDDLQSVEREARHSLDNVCGTLESTAAVFGPLVGGATVALADTMVGGGTFLPGGPVGGMPWLGAVVGWYVLSMSVVLTTLATGLRRGLDRPLAGYRIGRALCTATASFLGAYVVAGNLA